MIYFWLRGLSDYRGTDSMSIHYDRWEGDSWMVKLDKEEI